MQKNGGGAADHRRVLNPDCWHEEHQQRLFRCALARVRDAEAAADLVQETFLAAWKARHRFSGRASERTWLEKILRNKIADHFRALDHKRRLLAGDGDRSGLDGAGRSRPAPGAYEGSDPQQLFLDRERLADVRVRIEALPDRAAAVIRLCLVEGRDPARVCRVLGVSRRHLAVLLHRARTRLRADASA